MAVTAESQLAGFRRSRQLECNGGGVARPRNKAFRCPGRFSEKDPRQAGPGKCKVAHQLEVDVY